MSQHIISNLLVDLRQFDLDEKEEITKGGFGSVYRVKIPFIHDQPIDCAINITEDGIYSISSVKQFLFQVECQSSLKHPAILPIIGYSLPLFGETAYSLISPFQPNGTVENLYLKQSTPNALDTKQAIIIFGIAAGMAFCHQNNIIHRDLKPSNILLDANNYPKITDFALAKIFVEGTEDEVDMESMAGTPLYMAPEVVSDEKAPISNKIDVYSYAITLYEIFSGKHGYFDKKMNPITLMREVMRGLRPTIDDNAIPKIFINLINKCWSGDPDARPSFIEIVKDFMNRRDEYFNQPTIDKNALNNYIELATKDLKL